VSGGSEQSMNWVAKVVVAGGDRGVDDGGSRR